MYPITPKSLKRNNLAEQVNKQSPSLNSPYWPIDLQIGFLQVTKPPLHPPNYPRIHANSPPPSNKQFPFRNFCLSMARWACQGRMPPSGDDNPFLRQKNNNNKMKQPQHTTLRVIAAIFLCVCGYFFFSCVWCCCLPATITLLFPTHGAALMALRNFTSRGVLLDQWPPGSLDFRVRKRSGLCLVCVSVRGLFGEGGIRIWNNGGRGWNEAVTMFNKDLPL